MRNRYLLLATVVFVSFVAISHAQVTNLSFNNTGTTFTMTSGDTLKWEYNVPNGATTYVEFWYDVNGNGTIEPGTDVIFATFPQTDGQTNGNGGPPDMDGTVNGHVIFAQNLGLAPGKYVGKFTENGTSAYATGTINPLASPAHSVSGHVTPPAGKSAQYVLLEMSPDSGDGEKTFWDAFTDASGNYSIQMNSDTSGNPWRIRVNNNPFPAAVVSPQETTLVITGNHTGYDFTFLAAAAQVTGRLVDENDNPIVGGGTFVMPQNGGISRHSQTDASGFFQIGLAQGDLVGGNWELQSENNGSQTTTLLSAQVIIPGINLGDSLYYILRVYTVNSQITGHITIDGSAPGYPIQVMATSSDSGVAYAQADVSGSFTIPVSDKIYNYDVFAFNLPPNTGGPSVLAHPGQSGIVIGLITTSVIERGSGIPAHFALGQNYPNPFNPSTRIQYDIVTSTHVRLSIMNVLGQEIERLVDGDQLPGKYEALFDSHSLPSGVYFYRLTAGSSTSVKKMMLMR